MPGYLLPSSDSQTGYLISSLNGSRSIKAIMMFDPFALAAIIIITLLLPFMLFILMCTARRSGQDDWARVEQARHLPLPKRPYTQWYIDALDGEPRSRRPQIRNSGSRRLGKLRPSTTRNPIVPHRRAGRPDSRVQVYAGGKKVKRGARIDELWFHRL